MRHQTDDGRIGVNKDLLSICSCGNPGHVLECTMPWDYRGKELVQATAEGSSYDTAYN